MAVRTVLVSYLDHKKIVKLPPQGRHTASVNDFSYLSKEFIREFSFESNVKLKITFQRFNKEWEEDIDLEESDEIFDKDKLKAIVTPLLYSNSTPSSVCTADPELEEV